MRRSRTLVALAAVAIAAAGGIAVANAAEDTVTRGSAARVTGEPAASVASAKAAPVVSQATASQVEAAAVPTKTVWTRRSTTITYGQTGILEGQVQISEGALPNVPVYLYARTSSEKPWVYVTSTTTNGTTGLFRFDRQPKQNYYFKVQYRGDANYEASYNVAKMSVRRKLTPSYMTSAPSSSFSFYGPARPSDLSVGKTVKLRMKRCGSCGWEITQTTKTNSNASWKFRVYGPGQANRTYFYQAYIPTTAGFLAGYSEEWRIDT